jgi:hypothetical protein
MKQPTDLGDGPIEQQHRDSMEVLARNLDILLNGGARGDDRAVGFVLLVFPFGEREGRCNYVSNGADRRDVEKLLYEQAERFRQDRLRQEAEKTRDREVAEAERSRQHRERTEASGETN